MSFYKLSPLSSELGAEVFNFDLISLHDSNGSIPLEFIEQIKRDVKKNRILIFRSQKKVISGQYQVDFSNQLGKVISNFCKHPKQPHSEVFRLSNDHNEGCTNVGRSGWHIDGTFQYLTMYFPSVNKTGKTEFVGLKELYEGLTETEKNRWSRLWMMNLGDKSYPLVYEYDGYETLCFHCGEGVIDGWILEVEDCQSTDFFDKNGVPTKNIDSFYHGTAIQKEITDSIENMNYGRSKLKINWNQGDFAIIDNLAVAHFATAGTQDDVEISGLRILHRTTVMVDGMIPTKKDGRTGFSSPQ